MWHGWKPREDKTSVRRVIEGRIPMGNKDTGEEYGELGIDATPEEVTEFLREQHQLFQDEFGRKPTPNDPVFFKLGVRPPEPMNEQELVGFLASKGFSVHYGL